MNSPVKLLLYARRNTYRWFTDVKWLEWVAGAKRRFDVTAAIDEGDSTANLDHYLSQAGYLGLKVIGTVYGAHLAPKGAEEFAAIRRRIHEAGLQYKCFGEDFLSDEPTEEVLKTAAYESVQWLGRHNELARSHRTKRGMAQAEHTGRWPNCAICGHPWGASKKFQRDKRHPCHPGSGRCTVPGCGCKKYRSSMAEVQAAAPATTTPVAVPVQ